MTLEQKIDRLGQYVPIEMSKKFFDQPSEERLGGNYMCRFGVHPRPDDDWIEAFPEVWAEKMQYTSNRVGADEHSVWMMCPLDEIVKHVPLLLQAVDHTNVAMKAHHDAEMKKIDAEAAVAAEEKERIRKIQEQILKL